MVNSARLSIVAAACFSIYAFASVPFVNSEPTVIGPLMRIAVFSSWLGVAWAFSPLRYESFHLRRGLIGAAIPVVLAIPGTVLSPQFGPLPEAVVYFCFIAAYSFICGMFAAIPKSVIGALSIGSAVLVGQLFVDFLLGGGGAYGPYRFHM